jgi:hypothetical protein
MPHERNWKEYNEQLVRRGEIYISLDFDEMNYKKRGRPHFGRWRNA